MLTEEQTIQIKKQLIEQINTTFPEEKKASAIQQIESMDEKSFEKFLEQNNLIQEKGEQGQCIFCMIQERKIESYKIGENNEAIAVLEINPISYGHTIIIPKLHETNEITEQIMKLSNEISKKIKERLKPKEIEISESNMFGHKTINIIPIYTNETINSERKKASKEELTQLQEELLKKNPEKIEKEKIAPKKEINEKNTWLPRRLP